MLHARFRERESLVRTLGSGCGVSERAIYQGFALNAVDLKGRVSIPAVFRETIELNSDGRILCIGRHEKDPCLSAFDREWLRLRQQRINEAEARAFEKGEVFDRFNAERRAFGQIEQAPYDASGRLILSSIIRKRAGIELGGYAFFVGSGNTFEIWNPHVLLETPDVDEWTKDNVRDLLEERGLA